MRYERISPSTERQSSDWSGDNIKIICASNVPRGGGCRHTVPNSRLFPNRDWTEKVFISNPVHLGWSSLHQTTPLWRIFWTLRCQNVSQSSIMVQHCQWREYEVRKQVQRRRSILLECPRWLKITVGGYGRWQNCWGARRAAGVPNFVCDWYISGNHSSSEGWITTCLPHYALTKPSH